MKTETPRTDELNLELTAQGVLADRYSTMREHAQELERELEKAQQELKDYKRWQVAGGMRQILT